MEVMLRAGHMLMPEVGGQKRKFGIEIGPLSIPASYGMDGEEVSIIVNPRALAASRVRNPTLLQHGPKHAVDGP